MDNSESNKTVEELQNRLRSNIDSIQMLNHQVNILQRENTLQKEALEKEVAYRQTLQLQLESKNQFIHSFTSPSPQSVRKSCSNSASLSGRELKQNKAKNHVSSHTCYFMLYATTSLLLVWTKKSFFITNQLF